MPNRPSRWPRVARLAPLQELILAAVLGQKEMRGGRLQRLFRDPPAGAAMARWHIYETGLVARVSEAIENDFPALARVLGPGPLRSLTARYTRRFPPSSFDLGRVRDRLVAFLDDDELARDLPFLPDLAGLEWTLAEAFVAADEPSLTVEELLGLGPDVVAELPLSLRRGVAVVRSPWPIYDIWACRHKPAAEIDVPLSGRPASVLVSRRGLEVVCRPLDLTSLLLLDAFEAGRPLVATFESSETRVSDLVAAFRALVEDGVFRTAAGRVARGR